VSDAPEDIDDEWNLGQAEEPRGDGDPFVGLNDGGIQHAQHAAGVGFVIQGIRSTSVGHPPEHSRHALEKHRLENQIHEISDSQKCTLPQYSFMKRPVILGNQ